MTRKKELEALGPDHISTQLFDRGLDTSGSKAEMIDRLLEAEGQVSEPEPESEPEPAEPSEPEP